MIFILIIIFLTFLLLFFWSLKIKKSKKKLSSQSLKIINNSFKDIKINILSNKEKIIDYDKLYHKLLKEIWYNWTFWEILKQNPKEIDDINLIWELHKLRNKLAHDFDLLSENILAEKAKSYKDCIQKLINKLT